MSTRRKNIHTHERSSHHSTVAHKHAQDFTFGLTVDDEEDGIMGTIVVPANNDGNIDDGDLLCVILHRGDDTVQEEKQEQ